MVTDDAEAEKPMHTFDLDGGLVGKAFTGGNGKDPRERPRRFLRHASVRKFISVVIRNAVPFDTA